MPKYDDPQYTAVREIAVQSKAGNAAVTKFALFSDAVLKRARATVSAAGTSAVTGAYLDILVGTSSVGRLALGSSTAGSVVDSDFTDTVVPAGTVVELLCGTDATAAALVVFEYQYKF